MSEMNKYRVTPLVLPDLGESRETLVDAIGQQKTTLGSGLDSTNDSITAHTDGYNYKYQAAASADVVVKASAGYLKGIIVGAYVANATIEISDHASDGDGNVMAMITQAATNIDGFPKYIPVECYMATGICVDQLLATQVTYIYR